MASKRHLKFPDVVILNVGWIAPVFSVMTSDISIIAAFHQNMTDESGRHWLIFQSMLLYHVPVFGCAKTRGTS